MRGGAELSGDQGSERTSGGHRSLGQPSSMRWRGSGSGHGGDGAAEEQPGELHHASMHGGPRPSRVHNDACEFVAHAEILIFFVEETCPVICKQWTS